LNLRMGHVKFFTDMEDDHVEQPRGRRRPREPVDRLLGNPYLEFDAGTVAHTRCEKLRGMETAAGFRIDIDYFQTIGAWDRLREIVGDHSPWDRMFQVCL
jgi:hypothetical protein